MASPPFRAWRQNEWLRRRDYLVTKATEINPGIELEQCHQKPTKGRTIRKLIGGGAGEVQKKNSHKGKLNEKNFLQAN